MTLSRAALASALAAIALVGCSCSDGESGAVGSESSGGAPEDSVFSVQAAGTFWPYEDRSSGSSSGTAVLVGPETLITSLHVVAGADDITVGPDGGGQGSAAAVVSADPCSDLALLQVQTPRGTPMELSDRAPDAGTGVELRSYPGRSAQLTTSAGSVLGLQNGDTALTSTPEVLEHDAATGSGASGAPLTAEDGRLVAINFAGLPDGTSLAIPTDAIEEFLGAPFDLGPGFSGVAVPKGASTGGVWLTGVIEESAASRIGMAAGDVLLRLGDDDLTADDSLGSLCRSLERTDLSDGADLRVLRPLTGEILTGRVATDPSNEAELSDVNRR